MTDKLTERDSAYIRLKCLSLVVENGSRINACSPEESAQKYYEFITGKRINIDGSLKKPMGRPVGSGKKKNVSDTLKDNKQNKLVASPFGDSGRKKVLLS